MDRFVRRVASKLAADSAPQHAGVAAAAAPQRGARPEAVANPDADAADEAESNGEASSVEGEYSHITALLDELAMEQPAAAQWAAQLPSDAEVKSSFDVAVTSLDFEMNVAAGASQPGAFGAGLSLKEHEITFITAIHKHFIFRQSFLYQSL